MPQFIPSEPPSESESKAKIKIFNTLQKNLSDNWVVFHSCYLNINNISAELRNLEFDFIIFNQSFGLLIMQTLAGLISIRNGKFYQNGWQINLSPQKHARLCVSSFENYLKSSLTIQSNLNIAYAFCLPDCDLNFQDHSSQNLFITASGLEKIEESIKNILIRSSNWSNQNIKPEIASQIIKKLSPNFEFAIPLEKKITQAESTLLKLTEQQCELLQFISEHKRALIRGCAGSGKSVLAVKKAIQLASQNKKVLLLAYNSLLTEKLKLSTQNYKNITTESYHNLCITHLKNNGINISPQPSDNTIWTETIPTLFLESLERNPLQFDAVIVDEGQDFLDNYWIAVQKLVPNDGYFYIFFDPDQNLFNKQLSIPQISPPFILNKNCRNSLPICEKIKPLCSINIQIPENIPIGQPVCEFRSKNPFERRRFLQKTLENLLQNKIYERQIVILGGHSMKNTCIADDPKIGDFTIAENSPHDIMQIPYLTYMKFKGCESDAVILLDVDENDPRWNKAALCTAISRAKHFLTIIRK